jgi:hypothetical protein
LGSVMPLYGNGWGLFQSGNREVFQGGDLTAY